MKAPSLTLGVEEEYQIVDVETRELRSYITQLLQEGTSTMEGLRPELHQSVVEVGSSVCRDSQEVREEIRRLRRGVSELAAEHDLRIVAAATHPFSSWINQEITPLERYLGVEEDLQDLARRNLVFGMHVHVGIEDPEFRMEVLTVARYFLPLFLALSTSSPMWMGRNTGLMSYRSVQWRNFPRTGMPPRFSTYAEYEHIVDVLIRAGSIEDPSKIWWDIRPHHLYPTLEFRVCDVCTRMEDAVSLAAMYQAMVAKLWKLRRRNLHLRTYPLTLLSDNKWRAVRYGLEGDLIDLRRDRVRPARELIREFIEGFLDDVVDELGTRREVEHALRIAEGGTSAHRQLAVFRETGDPRTVVDHLIAETLEGTGLEETLGISGSGSPS
ncbi:MAG: carboxylate-amine ligase [Gemmatimonadota bacterium]